MEKKTGNQPNGENKPGILVRGLKPPHVKNYERAEAERFSKIEMR